MIFSPTVFSLGVVRIQPNQKETLRNGFKTEILLFVSIFALILTFAESRKLLTNEDRLDSNGRITRQKSRDNGLNSSTIQLKR